MTDEPTRTPEAAATDARFSLRWLIGVMTLVAIVAAIARVYLQSVDEETQKNLVFVWFGWAGVAVFNFAVLFQRRRNAELQAGTTLLNVPICSVRRVFPRARAAYTFARARTRG